jgi:hypothetical protein
MEKPVSELMAAISPEEWAQVPASVLELIQELVKRMDRFEKDISLILPDLVDSLTGLLE